MKKSKTLFGFSIVLCLAFVLSACGTPTAVPSSPTDQPATAPDATTGSETITVIMPKHEADIKGAFESRIKQFTEDTGIQVNLIQSDWDSVADRVTPELATNGSAYDVVEFDKKTGESYLFKEGLWVNLGSPGQLVPDLNDTYDTNLSKQQNDKKYK